MPDATIVIPCYNAAAYVEAALRSALDQTCRDIEVIAVDDRSTDATPQILDNWAARDKRLIVLRQAVNGGPSAACNAAYAIARGRWVTVLDSDDLYLPPRIERLVAEAEARGADMIADNLIQQDFDTGRDLGLHFPADEMARAAPLGLLDMLSRDMPDRRGTSRLGFVQPLIRLDLLRRHGLRFSEEIRAGEDFLHYFECVAHGARFVVTPAAYYVYRLRPGSITFRPSSTFYNSAANRRMMAVARRNGAPQAVLDALSRRQELHDFNSLVQAAADGQALKAFGYLHPFGESGLRRQVRTILGALRRRLTTPSPSAP